MAGSVSRSTHSLPEGSRAAEAPGRPPARAAAAGSPSAAEVLALQRSAGNHAVGNMLARRDPEEGTKTAISAKVFSKKSKWGELSIKLSRAATGPAGRGLAAVRAAAEVRARVRGGPGRQAQAHDAGVHADPARERRARGDGPADQGQDRDEVPRGQGRDGRREAGAGRGPQSRHRLVQGRRQGRRGRRLRGRGEGGAEHGRPRARHAVPDRQGPRGPQADGQDLRAAQAARQGDRSAGRSRREGAEGRRRRSRRSRGQGGRDREDQAVGRQGLQAHAGRPRRTPSASSRSSGRRRSGSPSASAVSSTRSKA